MNAHHQQGMVLIIGLFFLTIMTLIGVATVKNVTLEEKMAGNTREKLRSFEAAELALKIADQHLNKQQNILPFYATQGANLVPGLYKESPDNHPWNSHNTWNSNASLAINDDQYLPSGVGISQNSMNQLSLDSPPRYMIGLLNETSLDGMDSGISQKFYSFVVTTQAVGGLPHIRTTLQTNIVKAY